MGASSSVSFHTDFIRKYATLEYYLSKGAFGNVYGPIKWNGMQLAMKQVLFAHGKCRSIIKNDMEAKQQVWNSLQHEHLMRILSVDLSQLPKVMYIVMEFAAGGSLNDTLWSLRSEQIKLPIDVVTDWTKQIAEGMRYLHQKNIVHTDLKPSNILLSEPFDFCNPRKTITLKITDFDDVKQHNDVTTCMLSSVGTIMYMAPEVLQNQWFPKASDVWSFGVLTWEMLSGDIPHKGLLPHQIMVKLLRGELDGLLIASSVPEDFKLILMRCLRYDKNVRPTFDDILRVLQNPTDNELLKQWVEDKTTSSKLSGVRFVDEINMTAEIQGGDETVGGTNIDDSGEETSEEEIEEEAIEWQRGPYEQPSEDICSRIPTITDQDVKSSFSNLAVTKYFIDRGLSAAIYGPFHWQGTNSALKQVLFSPNTLTMSKKKEIIRQTTYFKDMDHSNLLKVFGVWFPSPSPALNILMEYAEGRSLDHIPLPLCDLKFIQNWASQIADGMRYLHKKNILHRNLKAENVLLMESPNVFPNTLKIGIHSIREEQNYSTVMSLAQTIAGMAPEHTRGQPLSRASDIWSYGILLYEIQTGKLSDERTNCFPIIVKISTNQLKLEIEDSCDERIRMIVTRCLCYDSNERPSFDEIQRVLQSPPESQQLQLWAEEKITSSKLSAIKSSDDVCTREDNGTIDRHRKWLKERLDPDCGLLDLLLCNKTLTFEEMAKVKDQSPFLEKNSLLLDYVLKKRKGDRLIEALRGTEQQHIVNYLNENGEYNSEHGDEWPLRAKEISMLDAYRRNLVAELDLTELLGHLYASKVINMMQMEIISSKPYSGSRNEALIDILRRRSLRDYRELICCLHLTKQSHIAALL